MIESTEDIVWSVDLKYRLLTFNTALYKVFERSFVVRAAAGMGPEDLLPAATAAVFPLLCTDAIIAHHGVLEDGATFIQKPFSPEELAGKVRSVLGPVSVPAAPHPWGPR